MPSKSKKQARFMAIAAHDADFAKKNHIPQDVAKEYHAADKAAQAAKARGARVIQARKSTQPKK